MTRPVQPHLLRTKAILRRPTKCRLCFIPGRQQLARLIEKQTQTERSYVHDSFSSADLDVAGRIAGVALQPVLGILPERWTRPRRGGCPRPSTRRSFVRESLFRVLLVTERCGRAKWWELVLSRHLLFRSRFRSLRSSHVESPQFCFPG